MFKVRGAALAALLCATAFALDTSKLQPRGYVNDFAGVLDPASVQTLESYCGELERATGVQMAIVTVKSLEDEPIEDVSNRLFRQWGIGKKGKDEGILLLLAIQDRKQRAEVGYGLEPIVTDGYAGGVLRGIRPILRQGNYGGALLAAAQEFGSRIAEAKGVQLTPGQTPPAKSAPVDQGGGGIGVLGIIFIVVIVLLFFRLIGGGGGRGSGGSGTGFLAGMLLGNLLGRRGGGYGGFGGGGFGAYDSGWGGGGGGFGGFGGGDSGGGGASSGW